jgi:hypothetical protein
MDDGRQSKGLTCKQIRAKKVSKTSRPRQRYFFLLIQDDASPLYLGSRLKISKSKQKPCTSTFAASAKKAFITYTLTRPAICTHLSAMLTT